MGKDGDKDYDSDLGSNHSLSKSRKNSKSSSKNNPNMLSYDLGKPIKGRISPEVQKSVTIK